MFSTRTINVDDKQRVKTNKEEDRVTRRSSVVPSPVQLSILLLAWLPKHRRFSVLCELIRRLEQASSRHCESWSKAIILPTFNCSVNSISSTIVSSQCSSHGILGFEMQSNQYSLACFLECIYFDSNPILTSNNRPVVTYLHEATVF